MRVNLLLKQLLEFVLYLLLEIVLITKLFGQVFRCISFIHNNSFNSKSFVYINIHKQLWLFLCNLTFIFIKILFCLWFRLNCDGFTWLWWCNFNFNSIFIFISNSLSKKLSFINIHNLFVHLKINIWNLTFPFSGYLFLGVSKLFTLFFRTFDFT